MEQIDRQMLICVVSKRRHNLASQTTPQSSVVILCPLKEVRYFSDCLLPYEKVLERKIKAFRSVVSNLIESDLPPNKENGYRLVHELHIFHTQSRRPWLLLQSMGDGTAKPNTM